MFLPPFVQVNSLVQTESESVRQNLKYSEEKTMKRFHIPIAFKLIAITIGLLVSV